MLPAALRANREVRAEALADCPPRCCRPAQAVRAGGRRRPDRGRGESLPPGGHPAAAFVVGVRREQIPELVHASRGSSMSGIPTTSATAS